MEIQFPAKGRDLRLDLLRGIANWAIFLDHIPNNAVNWITTRNYGFSDAADLFVYISGYTAALVYAKIMVERGAIASSLRLIKRGWSIYVAHVFLFVIYLAEIGYLGQKYHNPNLADEFNVYGFLNNPAEWL
ncbi:MAG: OpgC domain-containing protein, partial [Bradyrhizobium sp.]